VGVDFLLGELARDPPDNARALQVESLGAKSNADLGLIEIDESRTSDAGRWQMRQQPQRTDAVEAIDIELAGQGHADAVRGLLRRHPRNPRPEAVLHVVGIGGLSPRGV